MDITGQKFSRLTAVKQVGRDKGRQALWEFKCDCGNTCITRASSARNGNTRSCGCLPKEMIKYIALKYLPLAHAATTTHGKSKERVYRIYKAMKARCYNHHNMKYHNYGAKGITICDEWLNNSQTFIDWAALNGYKDNLTIDRKNNDKGYSPDNCRWVTVAEQNRNTSQNVYLTLNGQTRIMTDWAKMMGMHPTTLAGRLRSGWSVERAILQPVNKNLSRSPEDAIMILGVPL